MGRATIIVDASVVLVENIDRLKQQPQEGESFLSIVSRAGKEVVRPVAFAIIIIVTVFIPSFTLQGVEGKTFKPLAYTIALAMLGSLLFALFLAPVISSFLMKTKYKTNQTAAGPDRKETWVLRFLLVLYKPQLVFFVKHRVLAVVLAVLILVVGVLIFPQLGSEFTPSLQEGNLVLRLTMAPSISLTESIRISKIAEKRLLKIP
ncbi:MAG: efflux RND transporter permease subunit, partial [bacterium]|nr:efflux RND transporter permease subunit [bacterium]